jgi:hypothetical protein
MKRDPSQAFQKYTHIKDHGLFGCDDCLEEPINFELDLRLADY